MGVFSLPLSNIESASIHTDYNYVYTTLAFSNIESASIHLDYNYMSILQLHFLI